MWSPKDNPVRFSLLTVFVWLLVAGVIIFFLWQVINRISPSKLPLQTPTTDPALVQQTIAAVLTAQSSSPATAGAYTATPPSEPTSTQTPSAPVASPQLTTTLHPSASTSTPLVLCNQAAPGNPIDVTIPDDSLLSPGQSFTKTWKLVNVGTCTWTSAYSTNFFYGDQMGADASVPLQENVPPDHDAEISVEMVAPLTPGTYQGNWKLADASGTLFGIGPKGDLAFWVRIIVTDLRTTTPSPTITPTATNTPFGGITPTATPEGQVSGQLSPVPGDSIDLDSLTMNGSQADLSYQVDASQYHWLTPSAQAMIGVYGNHQPSLSDCQSVSMSSAPIAVESLSPGAYLCYRTNQDRFGRMLFVALDPATFSLTLDLLTWALP